VLLRSCIEKVYDEKTFTATTCFSRTALALRLATPFHQLRGGGLLPILIMRAQSFRDFHGR
jgi:hypothetical protein